MSDKETYSFERQWSRLTDLSPARRRAIIDIIEEVIIYFLLSFFFGSLIERIFFPENRRLLPKEGWFKLHHRSTLSLLVLIILQLILDMIVIFYIGYIARLVPFIFESEVDPSPKQISTRGFVIVTFVFIACQPSLVLRIEELVKRL